MTLYEKYKQSKIDFSLVGLERRDTNSDYFCTPEGAEIIGWTGVDGIHYCFIEGFQEVFSVSPMAIDGEYVHPVAKDFPDFLRLLLACRSEAAIEQAYGWSREQFESFLAENPASEEQEAVLKQMEKEFSLTPLEDPFGYIKELQTGFNYGLIPYKADYFQLINESEEPEPPEWKVYYDANFWDKAHKGRAGKEIPLNKTFTWGKAVWHIPSVYSCKKGLVIDFCIEAMPFEGTEEQRQKEIKYFSEMDFRAEISVDGNSISQRSGCGTWWVPKDSLEEGTENDREVRWILEHYNLPFDRTWKLSRAHFPWEAVPKLESLKLNLTAEPVNISAACFDTPKEGESITFTLPVSGMKHTLTVQKLEALEFPSESLKDNDWSFPHYYNRMLYTVSPSLPKDTFYLRDMAESDTPIPVLNGNSQNNGACACSIGIIGGADGPTTIYVAGKDEPEKCPAAYSSLHFQPVSDVKWQLSFRQKMQEDIQVTLL